MAKRGMITRTIETLFVTASVVDLVKKEVKDKVFEIPSKKYKDVVAYLNEINECEHEKVVAVLESDTVTKTLGMYEDDFIAGAFELDENRKPIA